MFNYVNRREFSVSPKFFLAVILVGAVVFVCALGYQNDILGAFVR